MKKAMLLGVDASDLLQARTVVESALGSPLAAHESSYRGGEYFRSESRNVHLMLQENFVEDDGEHTEAAFPQAKFLLYVDGEQEDVDSACSVLFVNGSMCTALRSSFY